MASKLGRGAPLPPSPIVVGDELSVVTDGTYSASPVFAGGSIYFLAEQGVTTVIAAGKEFRRLATNRLDGGLLASLEVAGGSLFLRTDSHLYRIMETLR